MTARTIDTLKANMPLGVTGGTTVQDLHDILDTFSGRTVVSVREFGAKGDDSTDDTAAIQAAINAAQATGRGGVVFVPKGVYRISSALIVTGNGIELRGEGVFSAVIRITTGNFDAVRVQNCQHSGVTGLHFWPPESLVPTAGAAVVFESCFEAYATNCFVFRHFVAFMVSSSTETRFTKLRMLNLYGHTGLYFVGTKTAPSFRLVCNDVNGANDSVVNHNLTWFLLNSYAYSLSLFQSVGVGGGYGIVMRDDVNDGTSRPSFLFCQDSGGDQNRFNALLILSGDTVNMIGCYLSVSNTADNVLIRSGFTGDATFQGCRIFGAYFNGIKVESGPKAVNIIGCLIGNNNVSNAVDAHGIYMSDGASNFTIVGNHIGAMAATNGNFQRYAVRVAGSSNHFSIVGNTCPGNVSGVVFDGSSGVNKSITGNVS